MQNRDNRAPPLAPAEYGNRVVSLGEIFTRYQQEVFRLSLGMLGDVSEAEDATQEVFLRAQRAWHRFDPQRASARTWLGHITMNYCRSFLGRKRLGNQLRKLLFISPAASRPIKQREDQIDIQTALQSIDEQHRSVVILRYYLEFTCAEIATVLQINEGTVRSRLSTARRRMRAALQRNDHDAAK